MINRALRKIYKSLLENRILSRWFVLFIDLFIIFSSTIFAYLLSDKMYLNFGVTHHPDLFKFMQITIASNLLSFIIFKTYRGVIRYSTTHEFSRIFFSLIFADFLVFVILYKIVGPSGSVAMVFTCTLFMLSLIALLGFRLVVVYTYQFLTIRYRSQPLICVYLWGVNHNTLSFARILNMSKSKYRVIGLVDDKIDKKVKNSTNLHVIDISDNKHKNRLKTKGVLFTDDEVIRNKKALIESLIERKIPVYITRQIDIENSTQLKDAMNQIRSIQIEDLLGRPQIDISLHVIEANLKGKTILVTGAAGSIGSEIVNQVASFNPESIICFDQAETPLNSLSLELKKSFPDLKFFTIIGDVRNYDKLNSVFKQYHPDIIYHAAAYKHVPMMEDNPCEAISTNVLGTKLLVDLAVEYNVDMFVMVSTDKAVNPTNIMGASKRIAEIYVQSTALDLKEKTHCNTKFVTTRFGNVLGSNGSVIPLFRKQIEKGGPVTVTDPEITRYFMTIPEACRLVLEASVIGESGYIYIFDMGKPVKIYDLAVRMIELAGLVPGKNIEIEFTGLRSGEKLYEELLADAEISEKTSHEKVMKSKVREYSIEESYPMINEIINNALKDNKYEMVSLMKKLVPEYISSNNSEFKFLDLHVPVTVLND